MLFRAATQVSSVSSKKPASAARAHSNAAPRPQPTIVAPPKNT